MEDASKAIADYNTRLGLTGPQLQEISKQASIKELNDKQAAEAEKDKTIAEQADTIELLKGCIMELADVVYGDGEEDTTA